MQAAIEDDQNSAEGTGQVKVRKRFYRNKDERYTFLLELLERGERLQRVDDANDRRLTRRASSMLSSHKAQIRRQLPHILAEMHKNERSRRRSFNLSTVQRKTSVYSCAWLKKEASLPPDEETDPYVAFAKDTRWSVAAKRLYLCEFETHVENEIINKTRLHPKNEDPDDYISITDMLTSYWVRVDFDVDRLEEVVSVWKEKSPQQLNVTGGVLPMVISYEGGSTDRRWRKIMIQTYLHNTVCFTRRQIMKAKMKRGATDPPHDQNNLDSYTLPEMLVKHWEHAQTPLTDLSNIVTTATHPTNAPNDD